MQWKVNEAGEVQRRSEGARLWTGANMDDNDGRIALRLHIRPTHPAVHRVWSVERERAECQRAYWGPRK